MTDLDAAISLEMERGVITLATTRPDVQLLPTGNTKHTVYGELVGEVYSLRIARFEDAEGVYLLYLDERGEEITDTLHDDLEGALSQAEFEFGIDRSSWRIEP